MLRQTELEKTLGNLLTATSGAVGLSCVLGPCEAADEKSSERIIRDKLTRQIKTENTVKKWMR